jgi:hypothetical protein
MGSFCFEIILTIKTKSKAVAKAFARAMEMTYADYERGFFCIGISLDEFEKVAGECTCFIGINDCANVPRVKDIERLMINVAQNAIDKAFTAEYTIHDDEFRACASFKYRKRELVTSFNCWTEETDPDDPEESTILVEKSGCGSTCHWYDCDGYRDGPHVVDIREVKHKNRFKKDGLTYEEYSYGLELVGCKSKERTINIPSEVDGVPVTCIGEVAFNSEDVDTVVIPESVKRIENAAFCGVFDIDIYFPSTLTELTEGVIVWGDNIRVHIPDTVTSIHIYAFCDCELTIMGKKGSCAAEYAKSRDFEFIEES